MAIPKLFTLARETISVGGTSDLTLSGAATVNGVTYRTWANAGAVDGDLVAYGIADTVNGGSEYGYATYSSTGPSITSRQVIRSTNANAAINCSTSAQVFGTAGTAEFLWPVGGGARNYSLSASVAASALTIAVKDENGSDASALSPVLLPFRNSTAATGTPVWQALRAASSLVISSGSTLGAVTPSTTTGNTTNTSTTVSSIPAAALANMFVGQAISGTGIPANTTIATIASSTSITLSQAATATNTGITLTLGTYPIRVWVVMFDDGGTLRVGAINCRTGAAPVTAIYPLSAMGLASSTAEGGGGAADSAGVFYTGTGVSSKPYIVLGYLEWAAGLPTAGTWSTAPTIIQLRTPTLAMPGTIFNNSQNTYTSTITTTSTSLTSSGISVTLTPTSAANTMQVTLAGGGDTDAQGNSYFVDFQRGSNQSIATALGRNYLSSAAKQGTGAGVIPNLASAWDLPGTTSSLTYTFYWAVTTGTATFGARNGGGNTQVTLFRVEEIMS